MSCVFYIKLNDGYSTQLSEDEMINYLIVNGVTDENAKYLTTDNIKYNLDPAEQIYKKFQELKTEHKLAKSAEHIGNEFDYEESEFITPQNVLDHPSINYSGKILLRKSDSDYIDKKVQELLSDNISHEEAVEIVKNIVKSWDIIGTDAGQLHQVLPALLSYTNNEKEFKEILGSYLGKRMSGTSTIGTTEMSAIETFRRNLGWAQQAIGGNIQGMDRSKCKFINGLNIDVPISSLNKTMSVHIDKLIIDEFGGIHVYNFRFSSNPVSDWSSIKKEKYRYEAALLKRALEYHGFDTSKLEIYDIPMIIEYSDDFSQINGIRQENSSVRMIDYMVIGDKNRINKYEQKVKQIFPVSVKITDLQSEDLDSINTHCDILLPVSNVRAQGAQQSAISWIKSNLGSAIVKNQGKPGYTIITENEQIEIDDDTYPLRNQELIEKVKELGVVQSKNGTVTNEIARMIKANVKNGTCSFQNGFGLKLNSEALERILKPYLEYQEVDGKKIYEWELIENQVLYACNILLFKNKNGQLDIVTASEFDPAQKIELSTRYSNILGEYLSDMNAPGIPKATYGNFDIFRSLDIMNMLLEKGMINPDFKFGMIKIISPYGNQFRTIESQLQFHKKITGFLNSKAEAKISGRIFNQKCIDSIEAITYLRDKIIQDSSVSNSDKQDLGKINFDILLNAKSDASKKYGLQQLIETLDGLLGFRGQPPAIKTIINLAQNSRDAYKSKLAQIYLDAVQNLNYLNGTWNFQLEKHSTAMRYILPQYANVDTNVRMVTNIYHKTLDEIATKFSEQYNPIANYVAEYFQSQHFGTTNQKLLGDVYKAFEPLYELDEHGQKTMRFKNPFIDHLDADQAKFLKRVLFHLTKVRFRMRGMSFNFKNENDQAFKDYINSYQESLYVPLKKVSKKTKNARSAENPKKSVLRKISAASSKLEEFSHDPAEYMRKTVGNLLNQPETTDTPVEQIRVTNSYAKSEKAEERAQMLASGEEFETDLELILADFIEKQIACEEMQKAQFKIKAILTEMHMLGSVEGNEEILRDSIKEIEDFCKTNMFGISIMEDANKIMMKLIGPLKSLTSKIYIAGNVKSALRDVQEGVLQNITRTLTKFQTDLTFGSVKSGYDLVIKNSIGNSKESKILSALCLRYRLSNVDSAKISARATSRGGLFDTETWEFYTLRGPDYLNRMVLFSARCIQDGTWDAWELDKNGKLTYNWRKDKRFSVYASGNTNHKDYQTQRGLYMSKIRQYNMEHPDAQLGYSDDLVEPYSQDEIRNFKMFSDSIYGAYDLSQRSKLENTALGQVFCMYSTFMNGIIANYLRKPGEYAEQFEFKQKQDLDGSKYWFDSLGNVITSRVIDGKTKYFDESGEVFPQEVWPLFEEIPIQTQGIVYTLLEAGHLFMSGASFDTIKENIWNNNVNRANLKKLLSDLLATLIICKLYASVIEYGADAAKVLTGDNVYTNLITEPLVSSSRDAGDGFKGLWAVKNYVMDQGLEPTQLNAGYKVMKDIWSLATFDKSLVEVGVSNFPTLRSFKKTITNIEKQST